MFTLWVLRDQSTSIIELITLLTPPLINIHYCSIITYNYYLKKKLIIRLRSNLMPSPLYAKKARSGALHGLQTISLHVQMYVVVHGIS